MIRLRAFAHDLAERLFHGRGAQSHLPARESNPDDLEREVDRAIVEDQDRATQVAIVQALAAVRTQAEQEPAPPDLPPLLGQMQEPTPHELGLALHGWTGPLPPRPWRWRNIEREIAARWEERWREAGARSA